MEEVKGYSSDRGEEEEEDEGAEEMMITITGEESNNSRLQKKRWELNEKIEERKKEEDLMELRLGGSGSGSKSKSKEEGIESSNSKNEEEVEEEVEKEHMFDKVVTPSDVGKLNRLVIPKQHAEKYSYWNSSQSYVMTKGWSRFVKEKKLDAGDIVSFHRGRAELYRHRLYIDYRPRSHTHSPYSQHHHPHLLMPQYPPNISSLPFYLPNHHFSSCGGVGVGAGAGARSLYNSPQYSPHLPNYSSAAAAAAASSQYFNNNFYTTLHQHHQQQYHSSGADHLVNNNMNPLFYLTSSPMTPPTSIMGGGDQHLSGPGAGQGQQQYQRNANVNLPMNMIIDSVPVTHHHHRSGNTTSNNNSSGKRLRLFGVNMECDSSSSSSSSAPPNLTMANQSHSPSSTPPSGDQHFDLEPFNYRRH
ncbi:unnamed protein product [Vicia faba]|uniref:TF-B3 domain-containing protein n=1 Tax=Vicia faba TaxID=3906 RepID=A0AAV1AZC4_VICFA|nr:unnamed protein product [Vicia faba]